MRQTSTPVQIRGMRQSTIGTFTTCGQRGKYYIEPGRPYTSGVNRAMGTGYHAGVEHLYYDMQETGKVDTSTPMRNAMKGAAYGALRSELDKVGEAFDWQYQAATARAEQVILNLESAKAMMAGAIDRLFTLNGVWDPDRFLVESIEHRFSHPTGRDGWNYEGTVDLVLRDKENPTHGIIVDHKTAKKKWRANKASHAATPQPGFYVPVIREEFGFEHVFFYFDVNSFDGAFERHYVETTPAHEAATRMKAHAVMEVIDNDGPYLPNTDSFLCSPHYCDFWEECPYSALKAESTN